MGMLFGGWLKEEEEDWKSENEKTGISWQDWKAKKDYDLDNRNLSYYKIVGRFRGVELHKGDIITNDINNMDETYLCKDFQQDGRPIVDLISNSVDFKNKPYPHDKVIVIGMNLF